MSQVLLKRKDLGVSVSNLFSSYGIFFACFLYYVVIEINVISPVC